MPEEGQVSNTGTEDDPWGRLDRVSNKHLSRLSGGDRLLLGKGYHGRVSIEGTFDQPVIIEPVDRQTPDVGQLTVTGGENWIIRGLSISPSHAPGSYDGPIVTLAEGHSSRSIRLEDCFVFTTEDASGWTAEDWKNANNGILAGRHGRELVLRNNVVLNTRFGINMSSFESICTGNVISDFSADGIRVTRDGISVQYNIIKNVYVGADQGDNNHDDAIQCFLFNKGTGTVKNVTVRSNIIYNHENWDHPLATSFQGIGFFDGPLVNFRVERNVVAARHWHGISLYDAQNSTIRNNVVYNPWDRKHTSWIMLGSKLDQVRGNTVMNNYAHTFKLEKDPDVQASGNKQATKEIFQQRRKRLLQEIEEEFGKKHPVADLPRTRE